MRRMLAALLMVGCAGGEDGLDTAAMFAAFDVRDGPPPGVTETRYPLECHRLEVPAYDGPELSGEWAAMGLLPVSSAIPGYAFDFESPPLSAMLYRRLDPEARAWMETHNPNQDAIPADMWTAQIPVDGAGHAIHECLFLAANETEDCSDCMFGWITDIELIIWE